MANIFIALMYHVHTWAWHSITLTRICTISMIASAETSTEKEEQ